MQLYNADATWAMCRAGFQMLDVYPLSASFPNGTDNSHDPFDSVHRKDRNTSVHGMTNVIIKTTTLILRYFPALAGSTKNLKVLEKCFPLG